MKTQHTPYFLALLIVILLLVLGSGCRTQGSLGFGFGHKGSSVKLKISSVLPREKADIWAMQGRAYLSEEVQQSTLAFPMGETAEIKV